MSVSLEKSFTAQSVALHNAARRDNAYRWTNPVELRGRGYLSAFGKPAGRTADAIARGVLSPLREVY